MSNASMTGFQAVQVELIAAFGRSASLAAQRGLSVLTLPFDAARSQYASGVQAGLLPRSILASRDLERALAALERFTLGPLARHV